MIFILLYNIFATALAYYNFRLIERGKRIYHALNGTLHGIAAVLIGWKFGWEYGVSLLCFVRVVFDTTLNIFRGLGVGYITPSPISIIDKIEIWFIHLLATILFYKKRFISDKDVEWVAIGFRILILATGIILII